MQSSFSRRRLIQGGLGLAAGAGLAACGGSDTGSAPTGWTEVTFSSIGATQDQKMFKDMIAAAQAETLDEKKIKIIWKPAPGTGWDTVMLQFASGKACDVQRIDDDRVYGLAVDDKIHQLDKWMLDKELGMDVSLYGDSFTKKVAVEGYQFSITPALSANVLYYNKKLFAEAGLEAPKSWKEPWSWDEFVTAVQKLTKKSGSRTEVYGTQFLVNVIQPVGYGAGDTPLNEDQTECGFAKPETTAAIDALISLIRDGNAPTVDVEALPLFNSGKLAMTWQAMDLTPQISKNIEWDIMPWPKTPLYATTKNYARTFVIPKSAKDPEAAFLALKALSGPAASEVIAKAQWAVPTLTSAATGPGFTDHPFPQTPAVWAETLESVDGREVDIPFPRGPIGDAFAASFVEGPLANGLLSGKLSAADYIAQGRQRVNAEIKRRSWNSSKGLDALAKGALTDPDTKVLAG